MKCDLRLSEQCLSLHTLTQKSNSIQSEEDLHFIILKGVFLIYLALIKHIFKSFQYLFIYHWVTLLLLADLTG
jgi:hypothetical protein